MKTIASEIELYDEYFGRLAAPGAKAEPQAAPMQLEAMAARDTESQIDNAFEVLAYNQELVQFADGKANTLILINSIALASTFGLTTPIPPEYRTVLVLLKFAFLITSFLAVGLSMAVVLSRIEPEAGGRRQDLVFFADMLSRSSYASYRTAFLRTSAATMLDDLLARSYRVASIASRKYWWYGEAQGVTVVACALWLVYIFVVQCFA